MTTRQEILNEAAELVTRQRESDYGTPEQSYTRIAHFWSVYTGVDLNATDVALMMTLLKVARAQHNPASLDSWVDIAGYAATGGEVGTGGKSKDETPTWHSFKTKPNKIGKTEVFFKGIDGEIVKGYWSRRDRDNVYYGTSENHSPGFVPVEWRYFES